LRLAIELLRDEKKITAGTLSVPRTLISRLWWAGREERSPLIFPPGPGADWAPTVRVERAPSNSLHLSLKEWPRLPFTALIFSPAHPGRAKTRPWPMRPLFYR